MGHKDLRLGQNVYILVFYNISLSWLLPLDGFQFNFLLRDCENDLYNNILFPYPYFKYFCTSDAIASHTQSFYKEVKECRFIE